MKNIKKKSTLLIVFAIALSLIVTKETNVSAKTATLDSYTSERTVKTKTKKTKYKNGKIKTKTTYYKNKEGYIYSKLKVYRKYNKSGKEYYAKMTEIYSFSNDTRYSVTVFSAYKKNGKTLGYTKVTCKTYKMEKSKGKWKYNLEHYSLLQTTSKGTELKKTNIIYYGNGIKSSKYIHTLYKNGSLKSSSYYNYIKNKPIITEYLSYNLNGSLIYQIYFDSKGNNKTKTVYKNGEEYQSFTWNGKVWVLQS